MSSSKTENFYRIKNFISNIVTVLNFELDLLKSNYNSQDNFEALFKSIKSIPNRKGKVEYKDVLLDRIKLLFENMWLNEMIVKEATSYSKFEMHKFYMIYVAFYYSLFTSISILYYKSHADSLNINHKSKLYSYNNVVFNNKEFKSMLLAPFNIILKDKYIYVKNKKQIDQNTLKNFKKVRSQFSENSGCDILKDRKEIKEHYSLACSLLRNYIQKNDTLKSKIKKTRITLLNFNDQTIIEKIEREIKKLEQECQNLDKNGVSVFTYLMEIRHFLHYKCSFIFSDEYYLRNFTIDLFKNLNFILEVFNFQVECFIYKKYSNINILDNN